MTLALSSVRLVVSPVDGRLGAESLSQFLQNRLGFSVCSGVAYAFTNRRRTRMKLLCWDATGVWLAQRRLHRGVFVWPSVGATEVTLDEAQWQWLIAGVDWQRLAAQTPLHWRV
jgi:transposase